MADVQCKVCLRCFDNEIEVTKEKKSNRDYRERTNIGLSIETLTKTRRGQRFTGGKTNLLTWVSYGHCVCFFFQKFRELHSTSKRTVK